jgi:hypothetical protein
VQPVICLKFLNSRIYIDIDHHSAECPFRSLNARLFWSRAASVGFRFSRYALFAMFVRALLVGFSFGLRCRNLCAATLAGSGSWYIASARLSRTGIAGLPAARVTRRLSERQRAAKHNSTSQGPESPHAVLLACSMHFEYLT